MKGNLTKWKLIDLDNGDEVEGQFPAEQLEQDFSASYSQTWGMGRDDPALQWVHGEAKTARFRAKLWAASKRESIDAMLNRLRAFIDRDPDLGRPHICQFLAGKAVRDRVIVRSIGGVTFDSLRPDGSPRGCNLTISLERYVPTDVELTDPNAPPSSTRYYHAAQGETYEHIARTLYHTPEFGDLIRRKQPDKAELQAGDLVVAPEPSEVAGERLEPYSVPLTRTAAFVELRKSMFERAAAPYESHILRG